MTTTCARVAASAACALLLATAVPVQVAPAAQMPDPKQMSGVPLPSSDVPAGTVTVRIVRGSLSNLVVGQAVELAGDARSTATTNDAGRAEFSGLKPGARLKAIAVVDGERLESQEFTLPLQSGVRLMLVASDPEAGKRAEADGTLTAEAARTGIVTLGDQSRFVIELGEDGLTVFNIYQIVNTAPAPVQPAVPVVFQLPEGALRTALLEGSSPQAAVAGDRVTVSGPFAPGMTLVQFAYTLPHQRETRTVTQRIPAALAQLAVVVQKAGDMRLSSPQVSQQRDVTAEGQTYILGQGPPLPAGSDLTFTLSGLPHAPTWPRDVALALAVIVLLAGGYGAVRGRSGAAIERRRLEVERERLFAQLTALEDSHRKGTIDQQAYAARRREIIATLERIYAALDGTLAT